MIRINEKTGHIYLFNHDNEQQGIVISLKHSISEVKQF